MKEKLTATFNYNLISTNFHYSNVTHNFKIFIEKFEHKIKRKKLELKDF